MAYDVDDDAAGRCISTEETCGMQVATSEDTGAETPDANSGGPAGNDLPPAETARASIFTSRDFEVFLRKSGFSRAEAKRITRAGFATEVDIGTELKALLRRNLDLMEGNDDG